MKRKTPVSCSKHLLMADKAFSTSHMANGATRLQPLIMNVGQAAGAASALAVESNLQPSELSVRSLQNRLIGDDRAPAAVAPLWDTAWHHSQWLERQTAALNQEPLAAAPPETLDSGRTRKAMVSPDNEGGYRINFEGDEPCQLITLEPAVNDRLLTIEKPTSVNVQGKHNPWGGWFRTSSLR